MRVSRRLLRVSREPAVRGRVLWLAVGAVIDVVMMGVGGGYALAGSSATGYPPAFRVLVHGLPFGLYGHGWILVSLGLANLWGLARISLRYDLASWLLVAWTQRLTLFYCLVTTSCLIGSIWLNHQYTPGFWWYLGLALFTLLVMVLPPTTLAGTSTRTGRA